MCCYIKWCDLTHSLWASHRLKTLLQEYKMKKQEVFPSGLSKASSPRSPVWYQVSVCVCGCVYIPLHRTWLRVIAHILQSVVCFCFFACLMWRGDYSLFVWFLMSHPATGLAKQTTFWAHFHYGFHSWRQMMSLPIRSLPLRKLPLVWHWFCLTAEKSAFLLLFSRLCLSVCAQPCFICLYIKWVTSVGCGGYSC